MSFPKTKKPYVVLFALFGVSLLAFQNFYSGGLAPKTKTDVSDLLMASQNEINSTKMHLDRNVAAQTKAPEARGPIHIRLKRKPAKSPVKKKTKMKKTKLKKKPIKKKKKPVLKTN